MAGPLETETQLWCVYLPKVSNEGVVFGPHNYTEIMNSIQQLSGGYTIFPSANGVWRSTEGKMYSDEIIPVYFMATEEQAHDVASLAAKQLEQEAVMIFVVSNHVHFVEAT